MSKKRFSGLRLILMVPVVVLLAGGLIIGGRALQEPGEVRTLKRQEVAQTDEGHQEYYFGLLNENEQRGYREILEGIRSFEDKFYLSLSGDNEIDRVYHAVLKDHPELFWVHNREKVYKTTYSGRDYCQFSPGYTYTEEQRQEITQAMENAYQEVLSQIPDGADDYTKVMTVYTYVIDNTEYVISDDDQSIAGAFWKKQAVCAGYAGAVQYLLERLDIPSRFVNGLRYTDEETIEIVQMVLSGKTNKDLVSLIEQLGGTAIGMCGIDAGMIQAKKLEGDYGYVGDITHINTEPIENAIANGYIPVIATVGTDLDGNVYNINADTAAAEIATALQAENIITLTDIRGLLQDVDDPDSLISTVTMDDIPALMERGIISGGMIPKIKGLEAAIKAGVKKAVMIDGRIEHSILIEIFSDEGIGTMFTK